MVWALSGSPTPRRRSLQRGLHPAPLWWPLQVERVGSTFSAMASREQMSYTMDCLKTSLPASLEVLCDAVLNPALLPHEVDEQKVPRGVQPKAGRRAGAEWRCGGASSVSTSAAPLLPSPLVVQARLGMLLGAREVAMTLLNERLVRAAYTVRPVRCCCCCWGHASPLGHCIGGARLGRRVGGAGRHALHGPLSCPSVQGALSQPLIPDLESLAQLDPEVLRGFLATNYSAPRLVLAASGVDHQQLVELATPMLGLVRGGSREGRRDLDTRGHGGGDGMQRARQYG